MNCGVYEIAHLATGRRYIGSAKNFKKRWADHRKQLRRGVHHSRYLQHAWSKYGEEAFVFRPMLICSEVQRLEYEQRLLDGMKPEFNASTFAMPGASLSEETKQVMSAAQRGWRRKYEWQGEELCLSDIAEKAGFDRDLLMSRVLTLGMSPQEAIARGNARHIGKLYEHDGKSLTALQWAETLGMHPRRMLDWLAGGRTVADVAAHLTRKDKALSIRSFCKLWGISDATVKSRLQKGDSITNALREPRKMDNEWRRA